MKFTKYETILAVLFLLTVPLVRPWIHGDGRGYYAFARTVLFQHDLDFEQDWRHGYELHPRVSEPAFRALYLTPNGHFWNHWTIGPAILWSPFLLVARAVTPIVDKLRGTHYADDGFSQPYMIAMAVGTLVYGFLALLISYRFTTKYVPERWAILATVGIWLATSFTFYLYVEPSFAHTHSAFLIALFVLLWDRTRENRTWKQWLALGAIGGLMMDTYYPNTLVLLLPVFESLQQAWTALRERAGDSFKTLVLNNAIFAAAAVVVFFPSLLVKKILWGSYFRTGYREMWYWNSPQFFHVCFSSHGVFSWTPILIPAVIGLLWLRKRDPSLSYNLLATLLCFTYFIGCYEGWHAVPSFGNRFFVSFTVFFILGLGVLLDGFSRLLRENRAAWPAFAGATAVFVLWNCGVIYQFAAHLFPQKGEVSWSNVAYNQFVVVPGQVTDLVRASLNRRMQSKQSTGQNQLGQSATDQAQVPR